MRVICIDDEKLALEVMERKLEKIDNIDIIGAYQHPLVGLQHILQEQVDVVFLDIELPKMNGLELADHILQEKPDTIIVFVTAYHKYAVEAFKINAIDYIVKPIQNDRLQMTIERIRTQLKVKETIFLYSNDLQVSVAGGLQFKLDHVYEPVKWRTSKAKELFLYLLQNHGKQVQKSTLMETLWDEYDVEKGYSILYTTVYNVRKVLSQFQDQMILHNTNDGYVLELRHVEVDVVKWEEKVSKLPQLDETSVQNYESVMQLFAKPYLDAYDYIWIEQEKQRLERMWYVKAKELATYYEYKNVVEDAIRWYHVICDRIPEMEEAYFSLMKLYAKKEDYQSVSLQFDTLIKNFEELSIEPSSYIIDWYEKEGKIM